MWACSWGILPLGFAAAVVVYWGLTEWSMPGQAVVGPGRSEALARPLVVEALRLAEDPGILAQLAAAAVGEEVWRPLVTAAFFQPRQRAETSGVAVARWESAHCFQTEDLWGQRSQQWKQMLMMLLLVVWLLRPPLPVAAKRVTEGYSWPWSEFQAAAVVAFDPGWRDLMVVVVHHWPTLPRPETRQVLCSGSKVATGEEI